jgi:sulfate transport system permease protein
MTRGGRNGGGKPFRRHRDRFAARGLPAIAMTIRKQSVLPGFGLSLGFTVAYLSLLVLIPLGVTFARAASLSWPEFWRIVAAPRALASYRLSFGASLVAALVNALFGLVVAWVLARYKFPGRRWVDALVDLPFALPTSVAGIALTAVYCGKGWIGSLAEPFGLKIAFTPLGVTLALVFIGLPFAVRTVQPVLADLDPDVEQAAASLGATRAQTFWRVILPAIWPATLTGFALSFARAVGEYGSVIFISGNMPMKTEIAPLLIVTKLEQYDYAAATAIAVAMLGVSFTLLLLINLLQYWGRARGGSHG